VLLAQAAIERLRHRRDDFYGAKAATRLQAEAQAKDSMTTMLSLIAAVSLLVGGIGVMNVMLMAVKERTREIGIRVAVGAQHGDITRLILRQGFALVLAGAGIGVVLSIMVNRLLKTFLFGVPSHDPVTLLAVVGVLAAVALLACWLPARRAARVHPMVALRAE
jgi:macrolide transport system ATP-binding/permease protein